MLFLVRQAYFYDIIDSRSEEDVTREEFKEYIHKNYIVNNKTIKNTVLLQKEYSDLLYSFESRGLCFLENLYLFYWGINKPLCKNCGETPTKFIRFSQGYRDYCSTKCSSNSKEKQEAIKQTCVERYGVEHITQTSGFKQNVKAKYLDKLKDEKFNKSVIDKRRKTKLETYGDEHAGEFGSDYFKKFMVNKYGVEHALQSEEIMKRFTATSRERFGADFPVSSEEVKNRIKKTNLSVFGHESHLSSPLIREKIKATNISNWGVENPYQSEEVKEIIKKTNIERYGTEWQTQSQNFMNKTKKTSIIKYGVEHHMNNENQKEVYRKSAYRIFFDKLVNTDRLEGLVEPLFNLEEYHGSLHEYKWKCNSCGNEFQSRIKDGKIPRCLNCFPILAGFSNAEKQVVEFIRTLGIEVIENDRKVLKPKEIDIYIPSHRLAIEYDGLFWHSELNSEKDIHLYKTDECARQSIHLLHVFEDEWVERQNIIKSVIKSKLGLYDQTVGARSCAVKIMSNKEVSEFYNINHLQGSSNSKINIGIFYNDELVSCLSLSKPRFNKKYDWEITRFANKLNTKVVGSFAKLFKYFLKNYSGSIITYSDRRYFDGSIYKQNGFTELKDAPPSYYYTDYIQRYNRINFQKHKLNDLLDQFDPKLTEWENMQLNGWDRIWDCGNKVFELLR